MDCDPNSLIEAAKCFRCIPKGMQREVMIYLLCQMSIQESLPVDAIALIDQTTGETVYLAVENGQIITYT